MPYDRGASADFSRLIRITDRYSGTDSAGAVSCSSFFVFFQTNWIFAAYIVQIFISAIVRTNMVKYSRIMITEVIFCFTYL